MKWYFVKIWWDWGTEDICCASFEKAEKVSKGAKERGASRTQIIRTK